MKSDEIVLYDSTNAYKQYEEARQYLFDMYAEDNEWYLPSDVSDTEIQQEIDNENYEEWEYLKYKLSKLLTNGQYILTGYCGRWNGRQEGGKFIASFSDFYSCIEHLDSIKITDVNGHLIIEGYHHDGSDRYELKKLTKKGIEYANKYCFQNDRQLHQKIMNCNFFSCLPRVASL